MKFKLVIAYCFLVMTNMSHAEETIIAETPRLSTQDIMDILVSKKVINEQRAQELLQ